MAERRLTYGEALIEASRNTEMLAQFDRLYGTNLCGRGTPIEVAVDNVTGRLEAEAAKFVEFFDDVIWSRAPREVT